METYEEINDAVGLLFGDGAETIVKSLTDQQKKDKSYKLMQNAGLATNAVSTVAGPAALYSAVRHRKEGGIPRDIASGIAPKLQNRHSKGQVRSRASRVAGMKLQRAVNRLNRPMTPKGRKVALAAGGTLIGLQAANWGGDMIATKLISDSKKQGNVAKAQREEVTITDPIQRKLKLVKVGTDQAFIVARKLPEAKQGVKKNMDIHWQGEISKMDTDKRQVFGWASIIEIDGEPVVDLQGDIMTLDTIEKAAYDYVRESRKGGYQHQRDGDGPKHVSDLVESFLVTPEKKEQMGLPDEVPTGWWVGFQINDDEVWQKVKEGKLPEFSIHGSGVRKQVSI